MLVFDSSVYFRCMLLQGGCIVGTVVSRWSQFHSVQQILQTLNVHVSREGGLQYLY